MENIKLCDYGCGREAKFQLKNGKLACTNDPVRTCPEMIIKRTGNMIGKKRSKEWRENISKSLLGKTQGPRPNWVKEKISKTMKIIRKGKRPSQKAIDASKEINRQRLLNGQAIYMNKCIKNPSKPEVMLRNMVQELYSNCEFQHSVFNYSLDVAIPNQKIAIEYDGYYHFDCQKSIDYHKQRQEKIEKEGWVFLRYNIFDKFPTLEKLKEDICNILKERKNNE